MLQANYFSNPGALLRLIGHGLLFLFFIDVANLLIPPQFMNPNWEFQLFSGLVERSAIPLIALALIFSSKAANKFERLLILGISWLTLLIGVMYLILLPIGISSAWRIDQQNTAQLTFQYDRQKAQIQQIQQKISQASEPELRAFINRISGNNPPPPELSTPEGFKNKALADLKANDFNAQKQLQAAKEGQRKSLLKDTVRLGIGSVIAATLCFLIWWGTGESRVILVE